MSITKKRGRPKKSATTTHVIKKNGSYNEIDNVAKDVNVVLKSLIYQDGKFSTKEATAISKLYGNQLMFAKIKLEAAKIHAKTNARNTTDVLALK